MSVERVSGKYVYCFFIYKQSFLQRSSGYVSVKDWKMEVYWRFKVLLCNLKNNGLLIASTWKRNPESFTFHLFMVLQLFTFDFYCFGIKVSTKEDVYCFYVCHTFIYCFYVCHMCIYCFYVCHMCIYLYCFYLHGCVFTLHRFSYGTKHFFPNLFC